MDSKKMGMDIDILTARATSMSGVVSKEKILLALLEMSVPVRYRSKKGRLPTWIVSSLKSLNV